MSKREITESRTFHNDSVETIYGFDALARLFADDLRMTISIHGAVLQKRNSGYGTFLGTDQSRAVLLEPALLEP